MIAAYAFLAAFPVQILVVSVLHPAWLAGFARAKMEAQLPGWDRRSRERLLTLFRAVNMGIAVLGLVLLGWLFGHMRSPDWTVRPVLVLLSGYGVVQTLPLALVSLIGVWIKKKALTRAPPEIKRTASLQRRGLFDIVSPLTVFLAVLAYVLVATAMIHIQQHPIPRFNGFSVLGIVTLVFALNAFIVHWLLYRRKKWPLETRAYRMRAVGWQIKIIFYSSIAFCVMILLRAMLSLLDIERWVPFAVSAFIIIVMLFASMVPLALRRQAEADRLGPSPAS